MQINDPALIAVTGRQPSSDDCFICGSRNPLGFQAQFYELANGSLLSLVMPKWEYQSYPGRLHGGISSTLLDETMGRAIMLQNPGTWGVTVDMDVKFLKPVPLDETLRVFGRITDDRRIFSAEGEILLEDGTVAVHASGRYLKMPVDKISIGVHESAELLHREPQARELAAVSVSGPLTLRWSKEG